MSTSARKSHTRIPSVKSTSTNNHLTSSATTTKPSSGLPTPATSPDTATPARRPSFTLTFGANNMGLTNGGVGASPSSSSISSVRSNGAPPTPVSAHSPGSIGKGQGSGNSGSGFRLRSLLPFGPNKNPTPISPNVSPSGTSNGSFGGFGSVKRSMSISGERKQSFSGSVSGASPSSSTTNLGSADKKGSIGKNSGIAKSHFGLKGTVGKGKGKAKEMGMAYDDKTPVISIQRQTDGKDGTDEFGAYGGSRSMDIRRLSSDTIVSSTGRQYSSLNSRSRSIDLAPGGQGVSTTSVPETIDSRISTMEDQNSDHGPYSNAPYSYSSSSTSTIPTFLPMSNETPSDSPDPLLLHQNPTHLPGMFPTGSSHDHPIDLSTIIEADSSGISKHLPSATSSEASISPSHSRAQSEEPQRVQEEHYPNSILDGLDGLLQPPTHPSSRVPSPWASTASLTPSSQGMEADESRSPSHSPLLQPFPRTPSPTLHAPHSPFAPPENSSSTPATSPHAGSLASPLRSPFHPNLNSSFRTRLDSESGLELSMSEVDQQVRDAIRNSIGSAGRSRRSGGSTGGLTGPRGWVEDAEVRVLDGDEDDFEDSFLDGQGEERIEEDEVRKLLDASADARRDGNQSAGDELTRPDRSISINFDTLDPDLRMLLSPNRLTPSPKKSHPPLAPSGPGVSNSMSASTSSPLLPTTSSSAAAVASSSVFLSPWSSGNGSTTIIAPTPTIARTTGIASIRSRKDALGVDLNISGPSKLPLKTPSPSPSGSTAEANSITSPTPSSTNSLLAKPPPLPLPSLEPFGQEGGTGVVASAKSALLGRRQAGQSSSLPRLKTVTKEGQGPTRSSASSISSAIFANPSASNNPNNNDATNVNTIGIPTETTPLSCETGFASGSGTGTAISATITSPSMTTIPSTTISSISTVTSSTPFLPSSTSPSASPRRPSQSQPQQSPVPLEATGISPSHATDSYSGAGFLADPSPSYIHGTAATAPPSPSGGVFVMTTSTTVTERMDRRPAFNFDEQHGASGRVPSLGRAAGAAVRSRTALTATSSRPTTPSEIPNRTSPNKSPSAPTFGLQPQKLQKLSAGQFQEPLHSSSSSSSLSRFSSSGRRVVSGDYPRTLDRERDRDRLGPSKFSPSRSQFLPSHRQQLQPQHLSPHQQSQSHSQQGSPEIPDAVSPYTRSTAYTTYSIGKGRNRRRSMSVGGNIFNAHSPSASGPASASTNANATRGFLAASQRARGVGSSLSAYTDMPMGRPGTSMSGFSELSRYGMATGSVYRRERSSDEPPRDRDRERKAPMTEWLGPRTAKAFRAAGLLDFDAPLGSASTSPSDFGGEGLGFGSGSGSGSGPSKYNKYASLRTPSRMTHHQSSGRRASTGHPGALSAIPLGPNGANMNMVTTPSPTSVLGSPTSVAFREKDRETPTRSESTAPTSVSGASWVRERDGERVGGERERERDRDRDRERERERIDDELTALKDRHTLETSALLGALSDSQRSAKVIRDENTELRERIAEYEIDAEKLVGEVERLSRQNEEMNEVLVKVKEEYEERLEEEMERAARAEEENARLREEYARLTEIEAEFERLKKAFAAHRARFGNTLPHTGSPLRHSSRPSSPSFDFDSGEVEGFGTHQVEMSAASEADAKPPATTSSSSYSSESKPEPKPFSTHTKSIHSPFLPSSTSSFSVPLSSVHTSPGFSEENSTRSLSRRISTSSIFPVPPANMSLLLHEDSIHSMDAGDHPVNDATSMHYSGSDYSGISEQISPPSSPTIAIPIYQRQQQQDASSLQGRPYQRHRENISMASSQSPTTPNFSMRSGSPESLFLRPEHEMHLRDMDSVSLDFRLDEEQDDDDGYDIREIPR